MLKPLTIGVDIRDLQTAKTGTKTYLEEVCAQFKALESDDIRFHFFDTALQVYSGSNKILKWIEHIRYQLWKQLVLPIKAAVNKCDIVFCTDNFVPIIHLGYKTIPVFHDAFFFENPENYGKLWLWLYKKTAIPAAKRATFVVTPTAYSKNKINKYTSITPDKLVVIPEGAKTFNIISKPADDLLSKLLLTKHNYLLHVGSMFKRKNIPALIKAFETAKTDGHKELKLVLAGSFPKNIDSDHEAVMLAIHNNQFKNDIILTGYLPDEDLSTLYQNALLYVFPSVNEGFGIPVLEAFSNNLPALVADNTCLLEVGGNAVLTFDPFNIDDISSKINLALNDEALRNDMINKGRERLTQFSWRQTALQLIELFKKAA